MKEFVSLEEFLPYVAPYAEHCPNIVARRAIRDTLIEIAQRTGSTTHRFTMETVAGQNKYEIELPHGYQVESVESVFVGDSQLKPTNREELSQLHPGFAWDSIPGTPAYYMSTDDPNNLLIVPAPKEDGQTIKCEAKFRFSRNAELFPMVYYERYVEIVAAGALFRILSMSGQSFSDVAMAANWQQIYVNGISEIRIDTLRDYTREAGHVFYRSIL